MMVLVVRDRGRGVLVVVARGGGGAVLVLRTVEVDARVCLVFVRKCVVVVVFSFSTVWNIISWIDSGEYVCKRLSLICTVTLFVMCCV